MWQGYKKTYKSWQHAIIALIKSQDFFIELGVNPNTGKNEWVIDANVAIAMEKAIRKTKAKFKELKKELIKEK